MAAGQRIADDLTMGDVPHIALGHQVPFDLSSGIEALVTTMHAGWMGSIEANGYMDLPGEVRAYLAYLERHIGVPVTYISTGPERDQLLVRE